MLIVLLVKLVANLFANRKEGLFMMAITLIIAVTAGLFLFKSIFAMLLKFQD
jgi:hypothetical protein